MIPWWGYLLGTMGPPLLSGLFPGLFGGGSPETVQSSEQITEQDPRGYQSPWLGGADTAMLDSLLRNVQSFSGAGMPGGVGNISPMISQLLALIGREGPALIEQMGAQPATGAGGMQIKGSFL